MNVVGADWAELAAQRLPNRRSKLLHETELSETPACAQAPLACSADHASSSPSSASVTSAATEDNSDAGESAVAAGALRKAASIGDGVTRRLGNGPRHEPARGGFAHLQPTHGGPEIGRGLGSFRPPAGTAAEEDDEATAQPPAASNSPRSPDLHTTAAPLPELDGDPFSQNLDSFVGKPISDQNSLISSSSERFPLEATAEQAGNSGEPSRTSSAASNGVSDAHESSAEE